MRTATERMNKYDINQISLEQQIYLMKADEKMYEQKEKLRGSIEIIKPYV